MLRTLFFFGTFLPFTVICLLAAIVCSFFSATRVHQVACAWADTGLWLAGTTVKTIGREHVPLDTPAIYMANHQSNFDILALYAGLPVQFRWLAKKELFRIPLFGLAMHRSGYISVDRADRKKAIASMQLAAEKIRQGTSVIIFPEGTRSPDGNLLPFKKGGFMLALQSGAPIVPVAISGSRDIMPKHQMSIKGGEIRITIFPKIETGDLSVADRDDLMDKTFQLIASATCAPDDANDRQS